MFYIKHLETFISGYQNNLNKIEQLEKENEALKAHIIQLSKQIQNSQDQEKALEGIFRDGSEESH
jgi:cell division protein FtsB